MMHGGGARPPMDCHGRRTRARGGQRDDARAKAAGRALVLLVVVMVLVVLLLVVCVCMVCLRAQTSGTGPTGLVEAHPGRETGGPHRQGASGCCERPGPDWQRAGPGL